MVCACLLAMRLQGACAGMIRDPELSAIYAELQRMAAQVESLKRMVRELDQRKGESSK
jgi:prefoldin subunit 5